MKVYHRIVSTVPSPDTVDPFVYSFCMEQLLSAHPQVGVHLSPTCPPPREPHVCSLYLWVSFLFHLYHILDSTCKWYLMVFRILKDDAVKVLHSICQQIWRTQQCPQDWKRSVFIPIPKKGNAKEYSDYCTIALISHASKVMLKILQARFQQYVSRELPDVQAGFRKGRGTRDQIANIFWIIEIERELQKSIYFCFIDYIKAFNCVDHHKLWKILKGMGIPDHLTCLLRNLHAGQEATVRTGQGTADCSK